MRGGNVDLPNNDHIVYLVDGQNRRVGKKKNGALVKAWLYRDQLHPAEELDSASHLQSRFVYATGKNIPDFMIQAGITYRILSDHLGSPRIIVDATTGTIVERMRTDEFGNVLEDSFPTAPSPTWKSPPFGFAGGLYDADTGLLRFGARDYDPTTGRWTSKDPIRFNGGMPNLYGYAFWDPINFSDANGLCPFWVPYWACPASDAASTATADAIKKYHQSLHNGPGDAYNHCLASCLLTQSTDASEAADWGWLNEKKGNLLNNQPGSEQNMDYYNNACGRHFAQLGDCADLCQDAADSGNLITIPGDPGPGYSN